MLRASPPFIFGDLKAAVRRLNSPIRSGYYRPLLLSLVPSLFYFKKECTMYAIPPAFRRQYTASRIYSAML